VTDADVLRGRIDPVTFAGGKMQLNAVASRIAVETGLARTLNLPGEIAAFGLSEVVDENMSNAARVHAIESGKDVSERTLIAFGGAAPLHAYRVAEKLNVRSFVIPTGAGVGSAIGFLRAPVSYELAHSDHQVLGSFDPERANLLLLRMTEQARAVVEPASFGRPMQEQRAVFMRYVGQGHEIAVAAPNGTLSAGDAQRLQDAFAAEYSRLYGRVVPFVDVEIRTWVVRVWATVDPFDGEKISDAAPYRPEPSGSRDLFDAAAGKFISVPVFERKLLRPGAMFTGPAVVVEDETTTIISGQFGVTVDGFLYLVCTRIDAR
jgi:N-methylhydantoinase A